MKDLIQKQSDNSPSSEQQEHYSAGYGTELIKLFKSRTVDKDAAFFIPYLSSGMSLLDCGCGPGTLTIGLSEVIVPGQAIGIDIEPSQIEAAKAYALERGISNVRFEVANVYDLPFPDASFDAVFAHTLLQHLKNPVKALREINRVSKPGAVIGVRDDDRGALIIEPPNHQVEKLIKLLVRLMEYNGGDPYIGRRHRKLLREAGFTRTRATASCGYHGTLEETTKCGALGAYIADSTMTRTAILLGWITPDELKELATASKTWGKNLDAFESIIMCEAVSWKE